MKCSDIMKRGVFKLYPEDSLIKAIELFFKEGISGAPVVDEEDALLGIISETDVLRAVFKVGRGFRLVFPSSHLLGLSVEEGSIEGVEELKEEIKRIRVDEVMTSKVHTVGPDDDVEKALDIMVSRGVNRVPVMEGKKVVGIITRKEVLKILKEGLF
ncbi:MAG: CBS domain-containing protein [Thermoplasmata archaeon]|nr:CBS domain-containing protein [Thermoplasmata archaeon]RLF70596.1 MAG: signal transduction protein [Thermoplasmata archaeon]HDD60546.1 CBS domain-containing protein [Euryarchaeota archaeon]